MEVGKVIGIFSSIVAVAMAWVIVSNGNTAGIIKAWGDAFAGSVRAAEGR